MNRHIWIRSLMIILFIPSVPLLCQNPSTSGVQLSYSAPQRLGLHEPAVLIVEIKNGTAHPIQVDLGQDRKGGYLFEVIPPGGTRVELPRFSREGISQIGIVTVQAHSQFSQELILNEWYAFPKLGIYEFHARLVNPIMLGTGASSFVEPGFRSTILIEPRSPQRLEATAKKLSQRIEDSSSYEDAAAAASMLSYIVDPVAVPYLKKTLHAGKLVEPIAIAGLERIANREAVEALISGLKNRTGDVQILTRAALQRIQQQTPDAVLRQMINHALGESPA